jgi:tetratricopeptide (TPR) repeat protein
LNIVFHLEREATSRPRESAVTSSKGKTEMKPSYHFVSYSQTSGEEFANWLVFELEHRSEQLCCWLTGRDPSEQFDPLEQVDEALRRCSSLIAILSDGTAVADQQMTEWRKAVSYNRPITVVCTAPDQTCPLLLDTRKLIDFSAGRNTALDALVDRLLSLSTPAGQLESLREQLAGSRRSSIYAKPTTKARYLSEIRALEQQIAVFEAHRDQGQIVHERIARGLERERRTPAEVKSQPSARLRIVYTPPLSVPRYFENRSVETGLIGDFLRDTSACILTVHGRGGVGKTALVCRVLRELENDALPDNGGALTMAAIVYLNAIRASSNLFPQLLSGLFLTLDISVQKELQPVLDNPHGTIATKLRELLPRLSRDPTIILLDNFEDVVSPDDTRIRDIEVRELLNFLIEHPQHSLKIIITTRIVPEDVLRISPVRQMTISLSDGLASPYAERVLRKIDSDGSAGFKDAPDGTLRAVARETRGFPRALEAFYQIIAADPSRDLEEVLSDLRAAANPAERLTQILVGEAFSRLLPIDQKVMQAVAIFGCPVSVTAVEYVLNDWAPYVDGPAALKRLVSMHFVRRKTRDFYLHPIDQEHSLSFLSEFEKRSLRARAADYYREIQRPRSEWKELSDIDPHLEQFRLVLEAGDAQTATSILKDVSDFLLQRGAFEQTLSLAQALRKSATNDYTTYTALEYVARAQWQIGRVKEAVAAQERVLEIGDHGLWEADRFIDEGNLLIYRRELGTTDELLNSFRKYCADLERKQPWDSENLATCLHHLSACLENLGYLNEALLHQERATALASRSSNTGHKEAHIHNLGGAYQALGQIHRAEELYRQALALADESKNPLWRANHLASLAGCALLQGRFRDALDLIASALKLRNEIGDLGGTANDMKDQAEILLTCGEIDEASNIAFKAYEGARDLKRPLWEYSQVCAEISIAQGKVGEAYRLLTEQQNEVQGVRWDFENLFGTTLLLQGTTAVARPAFARALEQSDLWLSRSEANWQARAARALALAGLTSCGDADALERSKKAYRDAISSDIGSGAIVKWKNRLQRLAPGRNVIEEILSDVFGNFPGTGDATLLETSRGEIFISYAREDKPWVTQLAKVLSPAIRNKTVDVWYDGKIKPGEKWRTEIENALKRARVGVLFVSPDFLASDFVNDEELPFLLHAAQQRRVKLLWIYVTPCMVEEQPRLMELQCCHSYDHPLDSLAQHTLAKCMLDIAREIKAAYEAR